MSQYVHIMNTTSSSLDLTALGLILDPKTVSADSFDLETISKISDVRKFVSMKPPLIALISPEDAKAARLAMASTVKTPAAPMVNGATRPATRAEDDDIVFEPAPQPQRVVPAHMATKPVVTPASPFEGISGDNDALARIESAVTAVQSQLAHIASLMAGKPSTPPAKRGRKPKLPAGQTETELGSVEPETMFDVTEPEPSPVISALVNVPISDALPVTSMPEVSAMNDPIKVVTAQPVSRNAELPDDEYIPNEPPAGMHPINDIVKRFLGYPPYTVGYTPQEKGAFLTKCDDVGILREIAIYARAGKVKDAAKSQLRRALKRMDHEANLGTTVK